MGWMGPGARCGKAVGSWCRQERLRWRKWKLERVKDGSVDVPDQLRSPTLIRVRGKPNSVRLVGHPQPTTPRTLRSTPTDNRGDRSFKQSDHDPRPIMPTYNNLIKCSRPTSPRGFGLSLSRTTRPPKIAPANQWETHAENLPWGFGFGWAHRITPRFEGI